MEASRPRRHSVGVPVRRGPVSLHQSTSSGDVPRAAERSPVDEQVCSALVPRILRFGRARKSLLGVLVVLRLLGLAARFGGAAAGRCLFPVVSEVDLPDHVRSPHPSLSIHHVGACCSGGLTGPGISLLFAGTLMKEHMDAPRRPARSARSYSSELLLCLGGRWGVFMFRNFVACAPSDKTACKCFRGRFRRPPQTPTTLNIT